MGSRLGLEGIRKPVLRANVEKPSIQENRNLDPAGAQGDSVWPVSADCLGPRTRQSVLVPADRLS